MKQNEEKERQADRNPEIELIAEIDLLRKGRRVEDGIQSHHS
mgnify:CR=1 FL=1